MTMIFLFFIVPYLIDIIISYLLVSKMMYLNTRWHFIFNEI